VLCDAAVGLFASCWPELVTSDEPGEFHLHAYQLDLKLSPKEAQTMKFKAYATGRFQFEWHPAANATPAPAHRHEPIARLEVFP
jgi:hypothetical protein